MKLGQHLITAASMTVVTTLVYGLAYPLLVTGLAQVLFPDEANGQLLRDAGALAGSRIIGQPFSSPGYFASRPSAAGVGYDATASSGSNLAPTNRKLIDRVAGHVARFRGDRPGTPVPIDLVTASGSGLDPHITPAAALFQVPRVARERGLRDDEVRGLVEAHVEGRQLRLLGEPTVNVLLLNLALDARVRARR